ncbi:glycosyltransferase family 10 domain-containing protein [Devosia sp.]|uniref:glycosyltransferase family 10 domain-containing protein n=1 Tax=Devosia sp. TaxID=1871048 RepID=UPI002FC723C6
MTTAKQVYIDPTSSAYYQDRLFDLSNPTLNRDDALAPFAHVKDLYALQGITVRTADYLLDCAGESPASVDYYSLGVIDNVSALRQRRGVTLKTFVIFEPPVVDPKPYAALPELTAGFEQIYLHNTIGDGYSLAGVDQSRLRKLYWPQPNQDVLKPYWSRTDRQNRIVVINGNHIPTTFNKELYSRRIEAMAALARTGSVDLYGRGWHKWWSRASMWMPYWRHRRTLMSIYKGPCASKYEVMSQYKYSLCFENMAMSGYITEKIFDCFYSGTIPIYLGASDIADLVPPEAYIDARQFASWDEIPRYLAALPPQQYEVLRNAGRDFVRSAAGRRYTNSLLDIFGFADTGGERE